MKLPVDGYTKNRKSILNAVHSTVRSITSSLCCIIETGVLTTLFYTTLLPFLNCVWCSKKGTLFYTKLYIFKIKLHLSSQNLDKNMNYHQFCLSIINSAKSFGAKHLNLVVDMYQSSSIKGPTWNKRGKCTMYMNQILSCDFNSSHPTVRDIF